MRRALSPRGLDYRHPPTSSKRYTYIRKESCIGITSFIGNIRMRRPRGMDDDIPLSESQMETIFRIITGSDAHEDVGGAAEDSYSISLIHCVASARQVGTVAFMDVGMEVSFRDRTENRALYDSRSDQLQCIGLSGGPFTCLSQPFFPMNSLTDSSVTGGGRTLR